MLFRLILLFGIFNVMCSNAQKKEILKITNQFEEKDAVTGIPFFENTKNYTTRHRYIDANKHNYREVYFFQFSDTSKIQQTSELNFSYDNKGRILTKTTYTGYNFNKINKTIERFKYNTLNKIIRREEISYYGNSPQVLWLNSIQNYTYDTNNNLIFRLDSTLINGPESNNTRVWQVDGQKFEYDSQKRLLNSGYARNMSDINYSPNISNEYKKSDKSETIISKAYYLGNLTQIDTLIIIETPEGKEQKFMSPYGVTTKKYNLNNQLIEENSNTTYFREERNKYYYNGKGLLAKEYHYENDTLSRLAHVGVYEFEASYTYDLNDSLVNKTAIGWFKVNFSGRPFKRYNYVQKTDYEYLIENLSEEINAEDDVILFPNPATEWVEIANTLGVECFKSVKIINEAGDCLFQKKYTSVYDDQLNGSCTDRIELSFLSKGVYLVVIETGTGKYIAKRLLVDK